MQVFKLSRRLIIMSKDNNVNEKLTQLLVEVTENSSLSNTITETTDIINEVGLDSIQMINFILLIEDEFDIQIDFENFDVENLCNLNTLGKFVSNHILE